MPIDQLRRLSNGRTNFRFAFAILAAALAISSFSLIPSAQALTPAALAGKWACADVFAPPSPKQIDGRMRDYAKAVGRKVTTQIVNIGGRADWPVNMEVISGDPNAPIVVLVNGFVWPRENSAPFVGALLDLPSKGGPAFNIIRYDMSGQGLTVEAYKERGVTPWYLKQELTQTELQSELEGVTLEGTKRLGLPADHPVVTAPISYGRIVVSPRLASRMPFYLEMAPMMRDLSIYDPSTLAWRNYLALMSLNPFLRSTARAMRKQGLITYYEDFYRKNPERLPPGVVREHYVRGGADRTNAATEWEATSHPVVDAVPHVLMVAEVDDAPLKRDQLLYFRDTIMPKRNNATLVYMRKTPHGMTAVPLASVMIAELMGSLMQPNSPLNVSDQVFSFDPETGQFTQTTIEALLQEVPSSTGIPSIGGGGTR